MFFQPRIWMQLNVDFEPNMKQLHFSWYNQPALHKQPTLVKDQAAYLMSAFLSSTFAFFLAFRKTF